jgi:hypothetical protein
MTVEFRGPPSRRARWWRRYRAPVPEPNGTSTDLPGVQWLAPEPDSVRLVLGWQLFASATNRPAGPPT